MRSHLNGLKPILQLSKLWHPIGQRQKIRGTSDFQQFCGHTYYLTNFAVTQNSGTGHLDVTHLSGYYYFILCFIFKKYLVFNKFRVPQMFKCQLANYLKQMNHQNYPFFCRIFYAFSKFSLLK
jgi:hypothetical protein